MMQTTRAKIIAAVLLAEGVVLGTAGIAIGHADDAPGAGMIGIALFLGFAFAAVKALRHRPAKS